MNWLRRHWTVFALLLAPLLAVGPAVFSAQNSIGAFDQIRAMAPWNGPPPQQAYDVLQSDSVLQFYVWRDLVFESWRSGHVPGWNPYVLGGVPLLANSQSGAMYPPHILVGLLRIPTGTGIDLLAWLHLWLAGWGVFRLVKALGGSDIGGVFAGLTFQLSPFMLAWTPLPSVISTVAWIPWLWAGVARVAMERIDSRRAGVLAAVGVGAPLAGQFLAGHLQFAAYGCFGAVMLAVGLLARRASKEAEPPIAWKPVLLTAVAGVGLGAVLASPQIIPVLKYSQQSHRRAAPSEEGYKAYVGLALPPTEAISRLVAPFAQGNPLRQTENMPTEYVPAIVRPGANYAESATTVGPFAIGFAALAFLHRGRRRANLTLAGIAGASFLLAIGTPLNRALYFGVPGWASTGSPGRIEVLLILAFCALAGLGFERVSEETPENQIKFAIGIAFVVCLIFAPLNDLLPIPGGSPNALVPILERQTPKGLSVATMYGLLTLFATFAVAKGSRWNSLAVFATLLFCIGTGTFQLIRTGDPTFLAERPAGVAPFERVAVINRGWSFVGVPRALYPPNTLAASRTHDLGGYDSLLDRDVVGRIKDACGQDPFPPANGNMVFLKAGYDPVKLAKLGVTKVLAIDAGGGAQIIPIDGPGRVSLEKGTAHIESVSTQSIVVKAQGSGLLTLRDNAMSGWSATVDDRPVSMGEGPWMTVELSGEGTHTLVFSYSPWR